MKKKLAALPSLPPQLENYYLGDLLITSRHKHTVFHIYSQRKLFETFWRHTAPLSLYEKRKLWVDYSFNRVGRDFYSNVVMKRSGEDFEIRYLRMMKRQFNYLARNDHFSRVRNFTITLENSLEPQIKKTIDHFDNYSRELHVVITFVGPVSAHAYNLDRDRNRRIFILNAESLYQYLQEGSKIPFDELLNQ